MTTPVGGPQVRVWFSDTGELTAKAAGRIRHGQPLEASPDGRVRVLTPGGLVVAIAGAAATDGSDVPLLLVD